MMQADHTQSAENQKLMSIALKEINRLNLLITEFLDYARPSDFKKEPIHFQSLLEEIVDSVKLHPLSKDVRIELRCAQNIYIEGHFDKLKQAFLNIMVNSLQAMESSEKKLLIVQLSQEQNMAQLKIKDTGIGISSEQIKKIFEPFHTTKAKGTGLGLAIVHSILEAHGAVVDVQSQLGLGTEFSMSFGRVKDVNR
jgi:two-component system sensor histidine kinase PilS (NtrC family)